MTLVCATGPPFGTPILRLANASQERSQDHILEFWDYRASQDNGNLLFAIGGAKQVAQTYQVYN